MLYDEATCERAAVMETAYRMCAAARTAPKARGIDHIATMVVTGDEKETVQGVLSYYGDMSAQALSDLTHAEAPWNLARPGL